MILSLNFFNHITILTIPFHLFTVSFFPGLILASDVIFHSSDSTFPFRYANYYYENGTQMRDLIKATGIRFVIKVTGQAGKFNVVPLLLNIGSGLGLLAIVS